MTPSENHRQDGKVAVKRVTLLFDPHGIAPPWRGMHRRPGPVSSPMAGHRQLAASLPIDCPEEYNPDDAAQRPTLPCRFKILSVLA